MTVGGGGPSFVDNLPNATWRLQSFPPSGIGEIDTFGQAYLHADTSHPDEEGHRLIVRTLLEAVLASWSRKTGQTPGRASSVP